MVKILIDNGHGVDTPGKRSPDGRLREYKYARVIASRVAKLLCGMGYDASLLVTEEYDVSLQDRCKRVNNWCELKGSSNVILVSVHVNAAGNGEWMNATGWSAYTSRGQTQADRLADCLYDAAKKALPGKRMRTDYSDGDADIEAGFYILRHTRCAAVLTENLFQDNREDVDFLLSEEGMEAIVRLHVNGVVDYLDSRK